MSKNSIREDKTCLNCNYVVENKFCPNCGQENTNPQKKFYLLFVHFFEDLTHYENSFWKTIHNLIFYPSLLTSDYLAGKRTSYLAPVRLYIFISFITFFLLILIPNDDYSWDENENNGNTATTEVNSKNDTLVKEKEHVVYQKDLRLLSKAKSISFQKIEITAKRNKIADVNNKCFVFLTIYESTKQLDSIQKYGKPSEKLGSFKYWINRKFQVVHDKYDSDTIEEKFWESLDHNLHKSLFMYMPIFAFVLLLFQNKKRWYYFDHGIFTLHYFSFLLLGLLVLDFSNYVFGFVNHIYIFNVLKYVVLSLELLYILYYFFPAHQRFYGESKLSSLVKGFVIFFINIFVITILFIISFYTYLTIH
ncbi:DUF3667 domain-containing protein [Flavobacterium sp.]